MKASYHVSYQAQFNDGTVLLAHSIGAVDDYNWETFYKDVLSYIKSENPTATSVVIISISVFTESVVWEKRIELMQELTNMVHDLVDDSNSSFFTSCIELDQNTGNINGEEWGKKAKDLLEKLKRC